MEPLGTSVKEPTIRETSGKFGKSMDLYMSDYDERRRSEHSGGTEESGQKSAPLLSDASVLLLLSPSPGMDSGESNDIVSGPANPIVVEPEIGNVPTAVSLDDGEPEIDTHRDLPSVGVATDHESVTCLFVWIVAVNMQVLYLFLEKLLLLTDVIIEMVWLWEVFAFHRRLKIPQTTPALDASISYLLQGWCSRIN